MIHNTLRRTQSYYSGVGTVGNLERVWYSMTCVRDDGTDPSLRRDFCRGGVQPPTPRFNLPSHNQRLHPSVNSNFAKLLDYPPLIGAISLFRRRCFINLTASTENPHERIMKSNKNTLGKTPVISNLIK